MSSHEIKGAGGSASGTSLAGRISTVPEYKTNGGSFYDFSEILSSRFDSLRLLIARDGAVFYVGREVAARDRTVLVKVFTGHVGGQLELCQLETRAAGMLLHRNIVKANPPEEMDGVHFAVVEYSCGSETLRDLLDREGWLEPGIAIGIAYQIADALNYAHGLGVLHLGICPETILVDQDGTALLIDFGLEGRQELAWVQVERSSHCPLEYASPEQSSGGPVDARSDLYSLGVVLYQMLTDRLPVDSQDPESVRQKIVTHSPLPPHLYCSDIPLSLSTAITRLLERDPERRLQNAASLITELDTSLSQLSGPVENTSEDSTLPVDDRSSRHAANPVEEDRDRDEGSPANLDGFSPAYARQMWEMPSITVVNPPERGIYAFEWQAGSMPEVDVTEKPIESGEIEHSLEAIPVDNSFQPASDGKPVPVILPLILGVVLALAVLGGIMGIARADRAKAHNPSHVESPALERGGDAGLDSSAPSSATRPEEDSQVSARESLAGKQRPEGVRSAPTQAAGAATSVNAAVRSRWLKALRPPVPSRARQVKRKTWRPSRYWRNYPYKRGR